MDGQIWGDPRQCAVMRNDRLVFAEAYGGRLGNEQIAVWSMSKAITARSVTHSRGDHSKPIEGRIIASAGNAELGNKKDSGIDRFSAMEEHFPR